MLYKRDFMYCLNKLALAIAVSSALVLSGCLGGGGGGGGGGSSGNGGGSQPGPGSNAPPANTLAISGSVIKGVVLGGVVKAWLLDSQGARTTLIAETTTSRTNGSYQLELPASAEGMPVLVEVTSRAGTLIRCDLSVCVHAANGAPSVRFGDDFAAPSSFELQALVPGVPDSGLTVVPSPFSTIVAKLAVAHIASGAYTDLRAAAIGANAQIANRLPTWRSTASRNMRMVIRLAVQD
jgi:hypothetical protein